MFTGRIHIAALLIVLAGCVASRDPALRVVSTADELQTLLAAPHDSLTIKLSPGDYRFNPTDGIDSTCGNCENPDTPVTITVGVTVSGKQIRIVGPEDRSAVIHTNAGYGFFFLNCDGCSIENLIITSGSRDTNGQATDAAIVVKNSSVLIRNNRIVDNIGDSSTVAKTIVGIMGIAGRENSNIIVVNNGIIRNSWDGIALYRDARAHIESNIVDGVDQATGARIGGGRGVGIGVTWNGQATVIGNLVKRYWKGIGLFVDAKGVVEDNIVEDIVTWGIALWDADKGKPEGRISHNAIFNTGACGASITCASEEGAAGYFLNNLLATTAQNPKYDSPDYYCQQCALAIHAAPQDFMIKGNIFYDNRRATADLPDFDTSRDEFLAAAQAFCAGMHDHPVIYQSSFFKQFCKDASD